MKEHFGIFSLLPAAIALGLAIWKKRVIESLLLGICAGVLLLDARVNGWLHGLLFALPNTFSAVAGRHPDPQQGIAGIGLVKSAGRAELLLIVLLLGGFIAVLERSGGALAFGEWLSRKVRGARGARVAASVMGCLLFTSAYFSALATGTVFRPIFKRLRISRAKLAFLLDSTSAPINTLIPISGWVAFMAALLQDNVPGLDDGVKGLVLTVPFNFYCLVLLVFVFLNAVGVIRDFGPMRAAEAATEDEEEERVTEPGLPDALAGTVWGMVLPLGLSVLLLVVCGLWNFTLADAGLGLARIPLTSNQILILCFVVGLLVAAVKYVLGGLMNLTEFLDTALEGSKSVVVGGMIIVLAVTLGDVLRSPPPVGLGAEAFLKSVAAGMIPASVIPLAAFLLAAFMGFSLGTAFGVWGVMIPLALPLGGNPYVVAAAILSGGTFGDHCSPISDTTIMSSIGAGCEHMQHVNTQLPYALTSAAVAAVLFGVAGFVS